MPLQIKKLYPHLWVDEEEDEGKNQNEESLIAEQLKRFRRRETFTYHKVSDSPAADRLLSQMSRLDAAPLHVLVVNFIDILSHARTESRAMRELASDEAAYRSITLSWFRHSPVSELLHRLASKDYTILITTDHGSIRVDTPSKVVGERNLNTNLRYKLGRNMAYSPKDVYEVKRPEKNTTPLAQPVDHLHLRHRHPLLRLSQQLQLLRAVLQRHVPTRRHLAGGSHHPPHHAAPKEAVKKLV